MASPAIFGVREFVLENLQVHDFYPNLDIVAF